MLEKSLLSLLIAYLFIGIGFSYFLITPEKAQSVDDMDSQSRKTFLRAMAVCMILMWPARLWMILKRHLAKMDE